MNSRAEAKSLRRAARLNPRIVPFGVSRPNGSATSSAGGVWDVGIPGICATAGNAKTRNTIVIRNIVAPRCANGRASNVLIDSERLIASAASEELCSCGGQSLVCARPPFRGLPDRSESAPALEWTGHGAVRTEHAAVSRVWPDDGTATHTLIKIQ